MSLGPEKIILILVVALIVFGPQRLPEIARQVGGAIRELRRMQDSVRGELEQVLHPDFTPPSADLASAGTVQTADLAQTSDISSIEETNHAALPPGSYAPDMTYPTDVTNNGHPTGHTTGHTTGHNAATPDDYGDGDITDDGFAGPRSFS